MSDFEAKAREIVEPFRSLLLDQAVPEFYPKLNSAIASALEVAEMRGPNDVWLWLESETVGVQREIVLSQMGRFKRATQKET
jgi:hypothetical protein